MSEGPKLYTNKPKKGKLSFHFCIFRKQSFLHFEKHYHQECVVFVSDCWLIACDFYKQRNSNNFKSSNRNPRNFPHRRRLRRQWGLSLLLRHPSSPQKSHLLGATSFSGLCFWLSILLLEVPFFLLFLSFVKLIFFPLQFLMYFCVNGYLFVYEVISRILACIKWCHGFLYFSLKEWCLSLLSAFLLDVVVDGYSVVRIGAGILISFSVDFWLVQLIWLSGRLGNTNQKRLHLLTRR